MGIYLGIDTSNYTTSCALLDTDKRQILSMKKLLPVKKGERGLRQSDAVFHHTVQLPELMRDLFDNQEFRNIRPEAVCYSRSPRLTEGSYMPCFLVGKCVGESVAAANGIEVYSTSHQIGHILAALYSCGQLDLIKKGEPFLAFHVSGGTTDLLLCKYDSENILDITEVGTSLDLKAGQCIDRLGVKLGLDFPCGAELEKLASNSSRKFKIKPTIKDCSCCLSGLENKFTDMLKSGESSEDTAKFCLDFIYENISAMTKIALKKYGDVPVIFAGGVMSDKLIKDRLMAEFRCFFAEPQLSCDNAVGVAVYAALKRGMI